MKNQNSVNAVTATQTTPAGTPAEPASTAASTANDPTLFTFSLWNWLTWNPDRLAYARDYLAGEIPDAPLSASERCRELARSYIHALRGPAGHEREEALDALFFDDLDFEGIDVATLEASDPDVWVGTAMMIFRATPEEEESGRLRLTA